MKNHLKFLVAVILLLITILACGKSGSTDSPETETLKTVVMGAGTVSRDGKTYGYQLLRLEVPGKEPAYAQWMPADGNTPSPAVLIAEPYGGISWNGDNPGALAEVKTPEDIFESAVVYRLNSVSVLVVFGRFYTGGDIQNDLDDMTAGFTFLSREPTVAKNRIAVFGGSWGGFEALYGAAFAPDGAVPKAGVALYPASDFKVLTDYVGNIPDKITDIEKQRAYAAFFAPYLQRMDAAAHGDYSKWDKNALLSRLKTEFLVVHDEWDTLIPFACSKNLVDSSNGRIKGLWFFEDTPLDLNALPYGWGHGKLQQGDPAYKLPAYYSFVFGFILKRIMPSDKPIWNFFDSAAFSGFASWLYENKHINKKDMEWAAVLLLDLMDSRITMFDLTKNPMTATPGSTLVTDTVNAAFGSTLSVDEMRIALEKGLP